MNYSSITKGYPKLKIKSENPFFCNQINRIIVEKELLVDIVEENIDVDPKEAVDIIVTDEIPGNDKMCSYLFLIVSPSEWDNAQKVLGSNESVKIYKTGVMRESALAEDIKEASTTIIAEGRSSFGLSSLAKELKQEKEKTNDYEEALRKSCEAQKMIMRPLFSDDSFDISICYKAYRDVSGDVLFIQKAFNKIFIMVADVTDHGYLAGMYGAALYALANNYVKNSSMIEQSVDMWGQYMVKASKMFQPYGLKAGDPMMVRFTANMMLCVIDLEIQRASFVFYGSGQEPPIIINEGGSVKALTIEEGIGAPIGDVDTSAKVYKRMFYPGSGLILYTDGATEIFADTTSEKDAEKMYSSEKVMQSASKAIKEGKTSSKEIVNYILKDASAYSIAENLESDTKMPNVTDDLTLMCIRWKGEYID